MSDQLNMSLFESWWSSQVEPTGRSERGDEASEESDEWDPCLSRLGDERLLVNDDTDEKVELLLRVRW